MVCYTYICIMRKLIGLWCFMLFAVAAMAQNNGDNNQPKVVESSKESNVLPGDETLYNQHIPEDSIYSCEVANRAMPKGGMNEFYEYLRENFVYPTRCLEKRINGSVIIRFVVEKDGRVSHLVAVEQTPKCPEFSAEAIRIIQSAPRWIPGKHEGRYVRSYLEIPIKMTAR